MNRYCLTVVITALTLAGCGANDDTEPSETASTPPTSTTSTPATTPPPIEDTDDATTTQYASLIASHEGEWRETVATIDDTCTDPDAIPICAAAYLTASYRADTLKLELSGATDDLGDPPAEIAELVSDTETAAEDYVDAYDAWDATGCDDPLDHECSDGASFEMDMALNELTRQFDAWSPYTG